MWKCPVCTVENPMARLHCGVCDNKRSSSLVAGSPCRGHVRGIFVNFELFGLCEAHSCKCVAVACSPGACPRNLTSYALLAVPGG